MSKAGAGLIVVGIILVIIGIFSTTIVNQYDVLGHVVYQQTQQGDMRIVFVGIILVVIGAALQAIGTKKSTKTA